MRQIGTTRSLDAMKNGIMNTIRKYENDVSMMMNQLEIKISSLKFVLPASRTIRGTEKRTAPAKKRLEIENSFKKIEAFQARQRPAYQHVSFVSPPCSTTNINTFDSDLCSTRALSSAELYGPVLAACRASRQY